MFLETDEHIKGVPVSKMREILAEIPDNALLIVNKVGNLLVAEPEPPYKMLGFIDFLGEEYESGGSE